MSDVPKPHMTDELPSDADDELVGELAALALVSGRTSIDSLMRLRTIWRDADDRGRAYLRRRMAET